MGKKQYLSLIFLISVFYIFCPQDVSAYAYISINKNQTTTKVRKVDVFIEGPSDTQQMAVSNHVDFDDASWENYQTYKLWFLEYGSGTKTVYVKFKSKTGTESGIYSDAIQLSPPTSMDVGFKVNNGAKETSSRIVTVTTSWSGGVEQMRVSNTNDFGLSEWITVSNDLLWVLSNGSGNKTVYVEFKDANNKTKVVSQSIKYNQPAHYIPEGTLLKGKSTTIYYLGYDGKIHPFFNSAIYHSWYPNYNSILRVSSAKLREYQVGTPVCVRQGTWLVRFFGSGTIYAVEPGCVLRPIRSTIEAQILYGSNWKKRVIELDGILQSYYTWPVNDLNTGIVDNDQDGIEESMEDSYGISDNSKDSDKDGLSDYEEINFWFTDPADPDTDEDGHKDGTEILGGFSPLGSGKISSAPNGTYVYPTGSLIKGKASGDLYYRQSNGEYYRVKGNTFNSNYFQSRFVIQQGYDVPFSVNGGNLKDSVDSIFRPQTRTKSGNLANL